MEKSKFRFIGIINMKKDIVETVNIEAETFDEATDYLSHYVYTTYNKQVPAGGHYYDGVVIDSMTSKTIGNVYQKIDTIA